MNPCAPEIPEGWVMTADGARPAAAVAAVAAPVITMPALDTSTSDGPPASLTKKAKRPKRPKPATTEPPVTTSAPLEEAPVVNPPSLQATARVVQEELAMPVTVDEETLALEAQMATLQQKLAEKKAAQAAAAEAEAATKAAAAAAATARAAEQQIVDDKVYSSGSEDSSDSEDDLDDDDLEMEQEDDESELLSEMGDSSVLDEQSAAEEEEADEDDEFMAFLGNNRVEAANADSHAAAVEDRLAPKPLVKNDPKTMQKLRFARKTMTERDAAGDDWQPSVKQQNVIDWYERIDMDKFQETGIIEVPRKKRFKTFEMMMRAKQKLAGAERARKNRQDLRDINSRLRFMQRQEVEQNREEAAARREAKLARKAQRRTDRFHKRVGKANKKLNFVVKGARDREQTRLEKVRIKAQEQWAKLQGSKRSKCVYFGGGLLKIHCYTAPPKPLPPAPEGYKRFFSNDERFLTEGGLHVPSQSADPYGSMCRVVDINPRPGHREGTRSHKRKADMAGQEESAQKKQVV